MGVQRRAGSHADLAISRIASRDIEEARDALAPVPELTPEQRINGIVHSVHQAVTRAGLADDAHDLLDQIEDVTHTPLKALPP
jgi:hypothetical protein